MTTPLLILLAALALLSPKMYARALLSRAKHPSLQGHVRLAKRIAKQIPRYEFDERSFFSSDGAPEDVAERRRAGLERLGELFRRRNPESTRRLARLEPGVSDLQFVSRYRVPFQYSRLVRERLPAAEMVIGSSGVTLVTLDGSQHHDLTGAYGVNLFGYDFYKNCIDTGAGRVRDLGPVLGPYHPIIEDNVRRLQALSGMDEVSFHMSGTEAVMQAVRLARYHTGRRKIVRFCGAYHGWWDDVQPGIGNPGKVGDVYTLKDMHADTLRVLSTRRDIACVLVNPLQALHANANAPSDGTLVTSDRSSHFDREAYTAWLKQLREVCTQRGIALILDEVFVGFRLSLGGAQEYFGVRADLVTYGKSLGGGLPIGVVCGNHEWMRRFRQDRPADICFARGTFNSHPYVMATTNEFLRRLDQPEIRQHYLDLDATWNQRAHLLNQQLAQAGVPVRVDNLSSIFTTLYTQPSRYNWMLQFYLNAEGLMLSWVGSGRLIFSLNYSQEDFQQVCDRFVRAASAMQQDGWWWLDSQTTNRTLRRRILREMLRTRLGRWSPRQ